MGNSCPSSCSISQLLTLTQNSNGKTNKCVDIHLGRGKKRGKKIRKMCKNLKIKTTGRKRGIARQSGMHIAHSQRERILMTKQSTITNEALGVKKKRGLDVQWLSWVLHAKSYFQSWERGCWKTQWKMKVFVEKFWKRRQDL